MYSDSSKIETKPAFIRQEKKPCTGSQQPRVYSLVCHYTFMWSWRIHLHFLGIAFLINDTHLTFGVKDTSENLMKLQTFFPEKCTWTQNFAHSFMIPQKKGPHKSLPRASHVASQPQTRSPQTGAPRQPLQAAKCHTLEKPGSSR